jgi:hypothetical protein
MYDNDWCDLTGYAVCDDETIRENSINLICDHICSQYEEEFKNK